MRVMKIDYYASDLSDAPAYVARVVEADDDSESFEYWSDGMWIADVTLVKDIYGGNLCPIPAQRVEKILGRPAVLRLSA